jgi:CBS domain-containing protein
MVVNEAGVVLGRLRRDALDPASTSTVLEFMEEGPTTIRADEDLASLVERMLRRKVGSIVVTDPDGRLIGIVHREDGERALATNTRDREET